MSEPDASRPGAAPASPLAAVGDAVWRAPRTLLVGVVRVYQLAVSPWLGASCRYTPTCSQYAVLALREYGAVRGSVLAVWRILRCNPFGGHGWDPPRWFGEGVRDEGRGTVEEDEGRGARDEGQ